MRNYIMAALVAAALLAPPAAALARVQMKLDLDGSLDYFAIPYPSDLRRNPDGTVDRKRFPVPETNALSTHYRSLADGMEGFGVSESAFIRFTGKLDPERLPSPERSVEPDSPVFIVNVDKDSPAYGERIPIYCWFHDHTHGALKDLLAVCPYPGFVLREETTYAVVVMSSLDPELERSAELKDLLEGRDPGGRLGPQAAEVYRPLACFLKDKGIDEKDVAAATVYTTGDPTRRLRAIIEYIDEISPLGLDSPPTFFREHESFYALASSYTAPQFQTGKGSQLLRGGKVEFEDDGRPIVQRTESIPVKIVIPKCPMPADGFPLLIYLHGGSNTSVEFLDHYIKSQDDQFTPGAGPARTYAERGIAGVSMGIVKNPERYGRFGEHGRMAELPFYNFLRGDALVGNHWQAAADAAALLRLMRALEIDSSLCPETDASSSPDGKIRFNPRLFFASGFSMGGTILGSWAGVEPGIVATIPSGASGHWGLLIRNFTAVPAKQYFFAWLTNGKRDEPMDARWPTISLIQAVLEPCDTITYGPHVAIRPFPGSEPKHIYLALGMNDFYTKTVTQNAVATSLGVPLAGRVIDEEILLSQRLLGYHAPQEFPLKQNVETEDGKRVTGAVIQWEPDDWTNEGHNVNYNLTETKHQYGCFLRTLIDDGAPTIPPPGPEGSPCHLEAAGD